MPSKLRALLVIAGCTVSGLSLSCKQEEVDEFGFTCIELTRSDSGDTDPFAETVEIVVTLNYEPCLIDYYTKHPEMRLDGPADMGPAVFEEWRTRLCSEDVPRRIACEIPEMDGFEQTLESTGIPAYKLSVRYRIPDPQGIAGRVILWGPAPLTENAECAAGVSSFVQLGSLSGVLGRNKDGKTLWQGQSFSDRLGKIDSKGSGCIKAVVAPVT